MHTLFLLYTLFAHVGNWLNNDVLGSFAIGTTAKQVFEEEIGVFGVLAYIIYKSSRSVVDGLYVHRPAWLLYNYALRTAVLCAALVVLAYLISMAYLGVLRPFVGLQVSITSLVIAPICAWIALGYHYCQEYLDKGRERKEAAAAAAEQE